MDGGDGNEIQKMTKKTTWISRKTYFQYVHYVMKTQYEKDKPYYGYEHVQSKIIAIADIFELDKNYYRLFKITTCNSYYFTQQHSRKIKIKRNVAPFIMQESDNIKHIEIPHVQHHDDGVNVFFASHYPLPIFFDEDLFLSWIEIDDNVFDYIYFVIFDNNVLKNKIHFFNVLGSLRDLDYHKTTHVKQMRYAMKCGFRVKSPRLFPKIELTSDEIPQLLTTHQCLCDFPSYAKYVKDFFASRVFAIIHFHEQIYENYDPECIIHRVFANNYLVKSICKNIHMQ
jgi:hypothetical protein